MAPEAPTTGRDMLIDIPDGEQLHRLAKERVAAREATLGEVAAEIAQMSRDLLEGRTVLELQQDPALQGGLQPMAVSLPEEDIPEMFRAAREEALEEAKEEAQALHQKDVADAVGRTDVHLTHEPENVLGHSDGDEAYVDLHNGINADTVKHEFQHVEDGAFMHSVDGLDTGLAADAVEDLPDALTEHVDENDEALTLTARAVLEKRATEAGGSASSGYQRDYVDPYDRVAQRMKEAGIDAEAVMSRLVESRDVPGYQKAVRQMVAYEALQLAA